MTTSDYANCGECGANYYKSYFRGDYCEPCQKVKTDESVARGLASIEKYKLESAGYFEEQAIKALKGRKKYLLLRWLTVWFIIGACTSFYYREESKGRGCVYHSLGSVINPGYLLGCEIFRKRWEIGK